MRCIGQGLESLKTFCAVMSLPNPVEQKSYDVINNKLSRVMKEVAEESMKRAAVEENSSSPDNLLMVSGDSTWKMRGHSSLIGVCTVIGAETGRLTDSLIDKLAHYYGNAIRCNSTSVKEMRKAIWAVWGHSCSTDDEPMHWFCPTNPNTWCKYNAAINNNLQNYKHKPSVAKAVRDVIKPVFADLSHPALLKKCLGGKTQNPNESLNSLIWKFCPKTIGSSLQIAEIAANLATSVFNDGNQIFITILEKFGLKINRNVYVSLAERDNRRIFTSRQRRLESSFEARRAKKIKKSKEIELFQEQEGVGAVLNQKQRPVVFASRTERNYTATERECLAVVWAPNKFRTYLGSLPFKVITDHVALTHLTKGKNLSNRMIRWALKLAEFNIEWEHQSGTQNTVADVLSRNPIESIIGEKVNWAIIRDLVHSSRDQLIEEQRTDSGKPRR
ncbi:retrovirus-related Pol polyprotein from transposon 17.6 [Trichonephila clavipes]|nr:retrovirus-related Pol polyprotein from transposon 17.6 [Trichonephila clavipes]